MKKTITCALAVALSPLAFGENNSLTDAEQKEGWKLLFDGKSATGWSSWKTKKPLELGAWVVEEGALTLSKKGAGDIYTTAAYENFDLSLEWKTKGNSGILIRVDPAAGGPIYKVAPEMQIERSKGKKSTDAGGLYALYPIAVDGEKKINPTGWNTVRIRLVDGKGTHWFNGQKVAEYEIGSNDWREKVAASKFAKWKGFAETKKGHIGLQDHGAQVSFRNVKIKVIK
ncbi:MAG: glycosyl hydrolase [Verrucomicrobiaceae bacterium]|nr:glycosyl hydrolase [Verrucomicrobiaceae bacterium]